MDSATSAKAVPPPRRRRLSFAQIPRKIRWIIYVNAAGGLSFGYLMIFITGYYPEIGIGPGTIGLLLGAEGAAMVTFAIPLGLYSDRYGRKLPLLAATTVLPFAALVFAVTRETLWLLLAALVAGVSEGGILAAWNAMIADQTTAEQRNEAFAFLIPIALVVLLRGYRETLRPREARPRGMDWRPLLKFSGLNGLIGLGAGFFIPLVPTWLRLRFGVPDTWSGPVLALAGITIGLSAVASTALAKRYGPVRAIVLATGAATAFLFSLAFLIDPIAAAGFYIVRAALMNMSSPIMDSFLMGIVEPEQRGLASAVNSIIWRLPNSITTVFGGILMQEGHYDLPIFLATAFYAAFVAGFFATFRKVAPKT